MNATQKTKVLIAADFFYPHWTGISKSLYSMVQQLENQIEFTVLTVKYDKNLKEEEYIGTTRIIREPYLFSLSRAKYSLSILYRFYQEAKKHDAIFINSPCTNILPFTLIATSLGKKIVMFHQGDLILPKTFMNRILENIFDIMTLIAFFLADKVSSYTRDYANQSRVLKPFLKKFTPLLMPILVKDISKIDLNLNTKVQLINDLKNQKKILFGFGGRFVREKGFDILFDAIPKVIEKIPNAQFVFAGETNMGYETFFEENAESFEFVKPHLTMLGLLNDEELSYFYKNIDFIVVPSRSDCFPLVQMEACLSGNPSIVTNIPGARYLVQATQFGLVCEAENSQDLADKIVEAHQSRDALLKNHKNVLSFLDNKTNVERIKHYITQ